MKRIPWLAIFLIIVGVLLLLSEFGYIEFRWQDLLRFWPFILIFWGLDLLVGEKSWAGWVALLLLVAILGAIFFGAIFFISPVAERFGIRSFGLWSSQGKYYEEWKLPYDPDVKNLELSLKTGVRNVMIKNLVAGDELVIISSPSRIRIKEERKKIGDILKLNLGMEENSIFFWREAGDLDLYLSSEPTLKLFLEAGVGNNELDLRKLKVRYLDIKGGVGNISANLPSVSMQADIKGGIGKITIYIPEGVLLDLDGEVGIGKINVDQEIGRWKGEDNGKIIKLKVSTGIGDISIKAVRDTI